MGGDLVDDLENRLMAMLDQKKLERANRLVEDNVELVIEQARKFIPEKAFSELELKFNHYNWPTGSGLYRDEEDMKQKEKLREERYGLETKLLQARHPKRVARLWEQAKPVLEEMYSRDFSRREDVAIMNCLFQEIESLKNKQEYMREILKEKRRLGRIISKEPAKVCKKLKSLIEESFEASVRGYASLLVGLLEDAKEPESLLRLVERDEEYKDFDDLTNPLGRNHRELTRLTRYPEMFLHGWHDKHPVNYDFQDIRFAISLLKSDKKNRLSFAKALYCAHKDYAEAADLRPSKPWQEWQGSWQGYALPDFIHGLLLNRLKRGYHDKDLGARKLMKWYSERVLERWKATAADHERVLSFFKPNSRDRELMALFYEIRKGGFVSTDEEKCVVGRFPEVLRLMIKDGYLEEKMVDPPLKDRYLKPDEILTAGGKALPKGTSIESLLPVVKAQPSIETEIPQQAFPLTTGNNLPVLSDTDLSGLAKILDTSEEYRVLYRGNHTVFIASEGKFPNGEPFVGNVYRLALLKKGAKPQEGALIRIKGQEFLVRKEKDYQVMTNLEEMVSDVNVDTVAPDSYTAIVDVPVEEFKEKYFRDFVAHALIHSSILQTPNKIKESLEEIVGSEKAPFFFIPLEFSGRTTLRTFEFDGKFGFQLKYKGMLGKEEMLFIGKTLINYLRDVGLSYFREIEIDELERERINYKIQEREFQEEHLEEILEALRGDGLARVLSHVLLDTKYGLNDFGERICKHCEKIYVGGGIFRPDLGEQWLTGENMGKYLHELAKHPETFINQFGNLRRTHSIISDAKDYTPVFVQYPEIMTELTAFAQAHMDSIKAHSEAFKFWNDTMGGVELYFEQEEIEEDPGLQKLVNEEKEVCKKENKARIREREMVLALQSKYETLSGRKMDEKAPEQEGMNFWSRQLMILAIYQLTSPNMLTQFAGQQVTGQRINYWISR